ncbi:hypothetical protein [Variovorax rhizosphaerae]|uniref:Uracil-DNA glycosylase-like domain-containing protein n=1 Tax=Variovorax rhizosphaerae TaxID=1836200 RepID=A0ABU8WS30_9BURK
MAGTFARRCRPRVGAVRHDLERFEHDLARLIGRPTLLRPFTCDGDPLRCEAMVVGTNPATAMPTDWWMHWRAGSGYDIEAFERDYAAWRESSGKRGTSITRERRNQIAQAAQGFRVLQTNAFAFPCGKPRDIPATHRIYFVLGFLIEATQPRIILALGGEARAALDALGVRGYQAAMHPAGRPNMTSAEARDLGARMRLACMATMPGGGAADRSGVSTRHMATSAVSSTGAPSHGREAVVTTAARTDAAVTVPRTKRGPEDPVRETEREKKVRRYLRAAREVEIKRSSDARNKLEGCKLRLERFWAELGWPPPENEFERDALRRSGLLHRCKGQTR